MCCSPKSSPALIFLGPAIFWLREVETLKGQIVYLEGRSLILKIAATAVGEKTNRIGCTIWYTYSTGPKKKRCVIDRRVLGTHLLFLQHVCL